MKKWVTGLLVSFLFIYPLVVIAQETDELTLTLRRDWGYGGFGDLQGRFSLRIDGPAELQQVTFFLDGAPLLTDTEEPFVFSGSTDDFPPGVHTLQATAVTGDGRELHSNTIQRNFLTAAEADRRTRLLFVYMLVPIGLIILLAYGISWWYTRRHPEQAAVRGPFGTAICSHCGRPYARHWWKLNLGLSALDKCRHCGRWSRSRNASAAEIEAALSPPPPATPAKADDPHKRLDDSRYLD